MKRTLLYLVRQLRVVVQTKTNLVLNFRVNLKKTHVCVERRARRTAADALQSYLSKDKSQRTGMINTNVDSFDEGHPQVKVKAGHFNRQFK